MVAFAPDYTPAQTRLPEKNRAGDFFWPSTDRAGVDRPGIETASGENEWFVYDERRGPSLAQGTQEKVVVLVTDEIYNDDLPVSFAPHYIQGSLMERDVALINSTLESGGSVEILAYGPDSDLKTLDAAIASFEGQDVARFIHTSHGPDSRGYLHFGGYGKNTTIHRSELIKKLAQSQSNTSIAPALIHCTSEYTQNLWDVRRVATDSVRELKWNLPQMPWEKKK